MTFINKETEQLLRAHHKKMKAYIPQLRTVVGKMEALAECLEEALNTGNELEVVKVVLELRKLSDAVPELDDFVGGVN